MESEVVILTALRTLAFLLNIDKCLGFLDAEKLTDWLLLLLPNTVLMNASPFRFVDPIGVSKGCWPTKKSDGCAAPPWPNIGATDAIVLPWHTPKLSIFSFAPEEDILIWNRVSPMFVSCRDEKFYVMCMCWWWAWATWLDLLGRSLVAGATWTFLVLADGLTCFEDKLPYFVNRPVCLVVTPPLKEVWVSLTWLALTKLSCISINKWMNDICFVVSRDSNIVYNDLQWRHGN